MHVKVKNTPHVYGNVLDIKSAPKRDIHAPRPGPRRWIDVNILGGRTVCGSRESNTFEFESLVQKMDETQFQRLLWAIGRLEFQSHGLIQASPLAVQKVGSDTP